MRILLYLLGVLALLRHLGFSGWWDIPLVTIFLFIDYRLKMMEVKAQGELEALKLFMKETRHGDK